MWPNDLRRRGAGAQALLFPGGPCTRCRQLRNITGDRHVTYDGKSRCVDMHRGECVNEAGARPCGLPTETVASGKGSHGSYIVPQQLPGPPVHFTNRTRELSILDAIRHGDGRTPGIFVLKGSGGVGKSALALRWLDRTRDRFHDGQLYARLSDASGEPVAVEDVLGDFIRSFGVLPDRVPAGLAGRTALFRSVTAGRSVAMLLEDAVSAAQVKVLLPASASSVVAVTSRQPLAGLLTDGAVVVPIDPLDDDSAIDLLRRHVGVQRVESEARPAASLVGLCAGLPIALCVIAAQLVLRPRRSMAKFVDELRDERRLLDSLSAEDVSLQSTFDLSFRALPADATSAYLAVGVFPGTLLSTQLVAAMLQCGPRQARRTLDALVDASMLDEVDDDQYRCHDLVRVHARGEAEAALDHDAQMGMARRALEWHLQVARAAGHTIMPSRPRSHIEIPTLGNVDLPAEVREYSGALAWLEQHRHDLAAMVRLAADSYLHDVTYALGDALQPLFIVHNHHREAAEVDRLALDAALAMGDFRAEVNMRKRLARVLIQLDDLASAQRHVDALIQRSTDRGYRRGLASGLKTLARLHARRGQHGLAVAAFSETVQILRELGKMRSVGLALTELGTALIELGEPERAAADLGQARQLLSDLNPPDAYNAARAAVGLARAHLELADPVAARLLLDEAVDVLESLRADLDLGRAHEVLGDAHAAVGDDELAREHRDRADAIFASFVDPTPKFPS